MIEHYLTDFPTALHKQVLNYYHSFLETNEPESLPEDQDFLQQLVGAWAGSDFVARSCIREPTLLSDLYQSGDLSRCYDQQEYNQRLTQLLSDINDINQLNRSLRLFRRREMIRIAWRDLADLAELSEILTDLSNLADALVDSSLRYLYQQQCQRFGQPCDLQGQAQQLIVLGMGKLGGHELNFSSDIDLIFTYPERGVTDGRRSIENEDFFRRLGQALIKCLQEPSADGFVYRVDMRLRPFGDSGPLVTSCSALEHYCQSHGREWERYAMIKARVIAGDKNAGNMLLKDLRPFVYRRYLDHGAFAALRDMKALINQQVMQKGLQDNIKLGPGGIREIEFIGQAFQLIYGGWEAPLRDRSIINVLNYLAETERLPKAAVTDLLQAYTFLRRAENRLQIWADQQTHQLPDDDLARQRLAFTMGFADWQSFTTELDKHRHHVTAQFQQIFAADTKSEQNNSFTEIWQSHDQDDAQQLLQQQQFDDAETAWQSLQRLRASFSYRTLSEQGRNRLHQLVPLLLQAIATTDHPVQTLDRIVRLLEAIARRSVYLALLIESAVAREQLVKLCAASPWIAGYLTRYPLLLDDLIAPSTLYQPRDHARLVADLDRELGHLGDDSDVSEQRLDVLRHFKRSNILRVAAADISGSIPLMIVSDHLTDIAEVLLKKVLEMARADLYSRFGQPYYILDDEHYQADFAIIAYGKLGGIELGYGSDLDIVFLHDSEGQQQHTDGEKSLENADFFAKLAQRIIHLLSAQTAAGELYEADTRLRPSGRSGLLVSSFNAFSEYQHHSAWTWEHQALVRARLVAGSKTIGQQFERLRHAILSQARESDKLRQEVWEMREKMRTELGSKQSDKFHLKQDRGGIADIEFIVQFLVLNNAHNHPKLITYTDNIRQLDALEQAQILEQQQASLLRNAYRAMRRYSHLLKLKEQSSLVAADQLGELDNFRQQVIQIWHELMESGNDC